INVIRENAKLVQDAIELDPRRGASVRAKLDILSPESLDIATQEELFAHGATRVARFLRRVPGVARSEISYTVGLNKFRMETFKDIVKRFSDEELAAMPDSSLEAVGAFVNSMTGRGRIPAFAKDYATTLNTVFFSPRNVMGNIASHGALFAKNPIVRREAWKSLTGFYATGAGVLATAKLAGFDVGIDPNASDFGKIILPGGTRVDIWGGNQQNYRLLSNLKEGGVTSATGKFSAKSHARLLADFIRQKLAPVPGWAADQVDPFPSAEPKTATTAAKDFAELYVPLVAGDVYDAFNAEHPALALGASAAVFFGLATNVNQADRLRGQLDRNEYATFTPEQQVNAIREQSWRDMRWAKSIPAKY
ncbi:MAG: hypothetical protein Q7R41_02455, partial [Phycisphaerales bacterium]|nr:hypothetical protein [Phycisphaerales bacterium]